MISFVYFFLTSDKCSPAHFGVPSALGRLLPEIWEVVSEEVGVWFIHRAPIVCMVGVMLSGLYLQAELHCLDLIF